MKRSEKALFRKPKDSNWKNNLRSLGNIFSLSDLLINRNYDVILQRYNIMDLENYYKLSIWEENFEMSHEIYLLFNEMNWELPILEDSIKEFSI